MLSATLREALIAQSAACAALGSPLTARVLGLLAQRWQPEGALATRLANWQGALGSEGASVPLRLAGALHALVRAGLAPTLAGIYRQAGAASDTDLSDALAAAFRENEAFVLRFIESAPQTNEVRRSVAVIAAAHWLYRRIGLPLVLSELGASAGINLLWDSYALSVGGRVLGPADPALTLSPDWRGHLPDTATHPPVLSRSGVDLNPLDPVADRARLLAYIWPDQPDRLTRTEAALNEVARLAPPVKRGDAVDWLAQRLTPQVPGALHLIFHTVAWQYFPPDRQAWGEDLLAEAGARATPEAPLARLGMEADGVGPGAGLILDLWSGTGRIAHERIPLGRVDFHGRWIDWTAP